MLSWHVQIFVVTTFLSLRRYYQCPHIFQCDGSSVLISLKSWKSWHNIACPSHPCGFCTFPDKLLRSLTSQRTHNRIIMSSSCQNHVVTSFWCNDNIIVSRVRWVGGYIHYGTPQAWLNFDDVPLCFPYFLTSNWLVNFCAFQCQQNLWRSCRPEDPQKYLNCSVHEKFSRSSDNMSVSTCMYFICQTMPVHPLYCHPGPRTCKFCENWQWTGICSQTTDQIELKLGEPTHYRPPPAGLINFWSHSTVFQPFPGLWLL